MEMKQGDSLLSRSRERSQYTGLSSCSRPSLESGTPLTEPYPWPCFKLASGQQRSHSGTLWWRAS